MNCMSFILLAAMSNNGIQQAPIHPAQEERGIMSDSIDTHVVKVEEAGRDAFYALKTNLAPWALVIPNIEFELQIENRITISNALWWSPYFISHSFSVRALAVLPEARYWFGNPGKGHFLGIHTGIAWYNLRNKDIRYQDVNRPLLNIGISYGFSLSLNKHLNAEFSIGAGYVNTSYDRFYNIDNGAKIDVRKTSYWGIDRLGISLVYHFDL